MKCESCGETYYSAPQWRRTDLALQGSLAYVVGDVVVPESRQPFLVSTTTGTFSAAVFFQASGNLFGGTFEPLSTRATTARVAEAMKAVRNRVPTYAE
jgi:hypothetical protein